MYIYEIWVNGNRNVRRTRGMRERDAEYWERKLLKEREMGRDADDWENVREFLRSLSS